MTCPAPDLAQTLSTERLNLRQIELSDAPNVAKYMSDYDISKMTCSFPYPVPEMSAEFWVMKARANRARRTAYPYAIEQKSKSGICGVMDIFQNAENRWELGYWLAKPFWGRGYITEAARGVMNAFEAANGPTDFCAGIFDDNPASGRVLEKLGFTKMGNSEALFSMARLKKANGYRYARPAGGA